MMTEQHLNEGAKAALGMSDAERIHYVRSPRWIGYTRAKQVLAKLEDLLTHPKQHRMPNLLIAGLTGNGKTQLVTRFERLHPAHDNPEGDGITVPVLYVQAPPTPEESRFYNSILEKLSAPYKPSDRVDAKQFQVIRILSHIKTRVLIIDEIHHILAGNLNKQRNFLNGIKYLGNELQIPIVGVGTYDAFNAIQTDPQLSNRFEPMMLPQWKINADYQRLLASFERMLPLKNPSTLTEQTLALKLLTMSEGIIGELSAVLGRAAVKAIEDGSERISVKLLDSMDWDQPSERKWKARRNA